MAPASSSASPRTATGRPAVPQFSLRGKVRWTSLGSAHVFSLDEARNMHLEHRKQVALGIDPIEAHGGKYGRHKIGSPEQRTEVASLFPTLATACETYLANKVEDISASQIRD